MMTQMPPPPSTPYQPGTNAPMNQPAQSNVAAIISLVCGIIGCMMITSIAAIICGIIGVVQARTLRTGRGMAIAGIILGCLWLAVGGAGFVGLAYIGKHGSTFINNAFGETAKPQITQALNDLADGDTTSAKTGVTGLSDEQAAALAAKLKPLGHVQSITITSSSSDYSGGKATFHYDGTAKFENGDKPFSADVTVANKQVIVDGIDVK